MSLRPLLVLLLAIAPLSAVAADVERFTADARGSLTVGPDGRVTEVELVDAAGLGPSAIAGVEDLVRSWRFEPIVEDGRPVNARGHMRLSLVAEQAPGADDATLGIRHAWFVDAPRDGARETAGAGAEMDGPLYPRRALQAGVGAELMLLLEIGADGKVLHAATERIVLLGAAPGPRTPDYVREFVRVAERTARDWRVPAFAGGMVRVPISFSMWRDGWARVHDYAWTPESWVLAKLAERLAIEPLSPSGQSSRLRLVGAPSDAGGG